MIIDCPNKRGDMDKKEKRTRIKTVADEGEFIFSENGIQNPLEFLRKRHIVDITSDAPNEGGTSTKRKREHQKTGSDEGECIFVEWDTELIRILAKT